MLHCKVEIKQPEFLDLCMDLYTGCPKQLDKIISLKRDCS